MLLYHFMVYAIFKIAQEHTSEIENLKKDDLISRQSIWTRDATSLGAEGDFLFLKIEGDERALEKAEDIIGDKAQLLKNDEKDDINAKFIADDEKANEGMGFIFG